MNPKEFSSSQFVRKRLKPNVLQDSLNMIVLVIVEDMENILYCT